MQLRIQTEALSIYSLSVGFVASFAALFIAQSEAQKRLLDELSRQRMNNLVLQMRPHYIYNTLMSIYYLCEQDPEKAQQVILDFTTYLQKNFSALGKEEIIPFTEELEHTRAHLAVEKARFENRLSVEYDTPCTTFSLPALTLQPIVENAVKHGIDPEHEAVHICISTQETNRDYRIIVVNSGADLNEQSIHKPCEALANIRERLKATCGGSLSFTARPNTTIVTVTLPKKG